MENILRQRGAVFGFLSRAYRTEVDKDYIKQVRMLGETNETEGLPEDFDRLVRYITAAGVNILLDLARDYARCFLGAGLARGKGAYPYESFYTSEDHLLEQEALDEVTAVYAQEGLGKIEEITEPADHISFEMEFMVFLNEKSIEALKEGNKDLLNEYLDKQLKFLNEHILRWAPEFCARLSEVAETDFYRAIADITADFLEDDPALIGEMKNSLAEF